MGSPSPHTIPGQPAFATPTHSTAEEGRKHMGLAAKVGGFTRPPAHRTASAPQSSAPQSKAYTVGKTTNYTSTPPNSRKTGTFARMGRPPRTIPPSDRLRYPTHTACAPVAMWSWFGLGNLAPAAHNPSQSALITPPAAAVARVINMWPRSTDLSRYHGVHPKTRWQTAPRSLI